MPIYEYHCEDCGETFEKRVSFSEADRAPACPKCASKDTHKKLSTIASLGGFSSSVGSSSSSCDSRGGFS